MISHGWFSYGSSILVEWEFYVGFFGGRKPENPEKNPRSKATANNNLNHTMAPGPEWNLGHIGERLVSPLCQCWSPVLSFRKQSLESTRTDWLKIVFVFKK